MSIPPAILDLRVAAPDRRPVHLWLPLFLLWPLFLVIGVLALVLTIVADIVLLLLGRPYHRYTILLARSFVLVGETRGTVVRFNDKKTAVDMTVQ
jgi:DMSO reductase anchor subunit